MVGRLLCSPEGEGGAELKPRASPDPMLSPHARDSKELKNHLGRGGGGIKVQSRISSAAPMKATGHRGQMNQEVIFQAKSCLLAACRRGSALPHGSFFAFSDSLWPQKR